MATTGGLQGQIGAIFDGESTLGLGPAELLHRFLADRDEAAFSAIVADHGPMVLATCRRILTQSTDADDAFQATFLVFARQARSIRNPDRLAPWLHSVARRVARRAKSLTARRRAVERAGDIADVAVLPERDPSFELRSVLDEELARLPEKYRVPLVLCYLEGLTHDEAAGQLQWPVGTVRSRMAEGRDRLRSRLARRGFAPSLLAVLSPSTLPMAVVSRSLQALTVRLVFTTASKTAATSAAVLLAQGALTSMFLTKVQIIAVAITLAAGTVGLVAAQAYLPTTTEAKPSIKPPAETPGATSTDPVASQPSKRSDDPPKELDSKQKQPDQVESAIKALQADRAKLKHDELTLIRQMEQADFDAFHRKEKLGALRARIKVVEDEMKAIANNQPKEGEQPKPGVPSNSTDVGTTKSMSQSKVWPIDNTPYIMIVSAERDRVTMVNTSDQKRSVFRLSKPATRIEPCRGEPAIALNLMGLTLEGPEISKLAVFDFASKSWKERELTETVTFATPRFDGVTNLIPFYLEGSQLTEAVVLFGKDRTWTVEKLDKPAPKQIAARAFGDTIVFQADHSYYIWTLSRNHWIRLDLKQLPNRQTYEKGIEYNRQLSIPGLTLLGNGTFCVQDGDCLSIYNPQTAELTQVNTANEE